MNPNDTTQQFDPVEFVRQAFRLPSVEQAVIEVEAKLMTDQLQEWLDMCEEELQ